MGWDRSKLSAVLRRQIAAAEAQAVARRVPTAQPQPDTGPPLGAPAPAESGCAPRVTVRITRFACALLDFDNGAGGCKHLVDALRHENLIFNDDPASIDFQFRQVQVGTRAEQGTLIEIL
jgi:hypothetical protein